MSAGRDERRDSATSPRTAELLGSVLALVALIAAVAVAVAIDDIATGRLSLGVVTLTVALATRLIVALGVDGALVTMSRQLRRRWSDQARFRLAQSTPGELHALDTAVDHISETPALAATRAGAGASLVALLVLFVAGGWLPLVIVMGLMALSVPAYVSVGRHSHAMVEEFHRRRGSLVARQLALLRSMVDLRALGAVDFGADEVAAASNAENRAVIDGVRVTIRSSLVTEFLGGVSVGLVAMVVGIRLWHHSISLTSALVAVLVVAEMFVWLRRYGTEFHRRDDAAKAATTLSSASATAEPEFCLELINARAVVTEAPSTSVDLVVRSGERVRVTGPSGIGKSSLIEAVLGLRAPQSGSVQRGSGRVGLVRADSRLLHATLRENLDPSGERTDEEIGATIAAVGLSPRRFANLEEVLDDDGRSISSGERVQLVVARSLLARVDLLVLDDVAGLLDETTRHRLGQLVEGHPELGVLEACHDVALVEATSTIDLVSA